MAPRKPSRDLDLFDLCRQLQRAGWDAFASDLAGEVAARQEHTRSREVWSFVIDRSGRWRFTATRPIEMADDRALVRDGRWFRLLKEKQQVLTVAGNLGSQDDLPGVLAELTRLALEETSQPSHAVEGTTTWPEEQDPQVETTDL